jgi:hypothetical protein
MVAADRAGASNKSARPIDNMVSMNALNPYM